MSEIEKIKRYVEQTKIPLKCSRAYDMPMTDVKALADMANNDQSGAVIWAFTYGLARGYRAGRKSMEVLA